MYCIEIPTGPRLPSSASKVDNFVKDAASNAPIKPPIGQISSKSTPTPTPAPPGLSSAQDFPSLPAPSAPPAAPPKVQRKVTAKAIKPVVPVLPTVSALKGAPAAEAQPSEQLPKPTESVLEPSASHTPKESVDVAPAETSGFDRTISAADPPIAVPDEKSYTIKSAEKRQRPGQIDLEAAKEASKKELAFANASNHGTKTSDKGTSAAIAAARQSQPATPITAVSQASASLALAEQSKTNRLFPNKRETPPRPNPSFPTASQPLTANKQASRRPSVTSIQQPGTPISERVSDNASFTSTSLSRTNSPPPSRVGTAPVRHVTKSQQRKERQTRAKQAEEVTKVGKPPVKIEEPVQAPIVGRKKKTKKAKAGTADTTPAGTRPPSPELKEVDTQISIEEKNMAQSPTKDNRKRNPKALQDAKPEEQLSEPQVATAEDNSKPALSISSLFTSLIESGDLNPSSPDLFKTVLGLNQRYDNTIDITTTSLPILTKQQTQHLDAGEVLGIEYGNNQRCIVFPDRKCLRGFSAPQANRYLELANANPGGSRPLAAFEDHLAPRLESVTDAAVAAAAAAAAAEPRDSEDWELVNRFASGPRGTSSGIPGPAASRAIPGGWYAGTGSTTTAWQPPTVLARSTASGGRGIEEAEAAYAVARRETEAIEKKLNALLKRNRRLM